MSTGKKRLISIVMCVYNGEKFLAAQIESILNQSYSNFELLILNDQSTDNSDTIIGYYKNIDSRIKYVENQINLGFNKNFEKGIDLSQGELIAISDQDDVWDLNKLTILSESIDCNLLIYSNSELIDEEGNKLNRKLDHNIKHIDSPTFRSFLNDNFITGHTCLFKRELLKSALPLPENIFFYDWWLGFTASYVGKVKYLNLVLTNYRIHNDSVMSKLGRIHKNEVIYEKRRLQLTEFANASFLDVKDKTFILDFLTKRSNSRKGILNFIKCYTFLLKYHSEIYPWYRKPLIKKFNYLRKQCFKG